MKKEDKEITIAVSVKDGGEVKAAAEFILNMMEHVNSPVDYKGVVDASICAIQRDIINNSESGCVEDNNHDC